MKIKLFPFLSDDKIEATVSRETITLNGEIIDLSLIPDGHELSASAIGNPWFSASDTIARVDGELSFCLKLPVSADSPAEILQAQNPIQLFVTSGRVEFPDTSACVLPEQVQPATSRPT
ncbi:hypothetical protein [Pseudomonas fluorescens]